MREALITWTMINVITPICVLTVFALANFEPPTQSQMVYLVVLAMLMANITAMVQYNAFRWSFGLMFVLNPLALFLLGAVSFVTAVPDLPLLLKSIYRLALEADYQVGRQVVTMMC